MEKAYDKKALVAKLKERGLDLAEEAAKDLLESTMDWIAESAILSENKVDDIVAPLFPIIKPHLLEQIDKIDGEVG